LEIGAVNGSPKIIIGGVEVAASGRQASMPQNALDLGKMGATMKQSTSKAVAEHVGSKVVKAICKDQEFCDTSKIAGSLRDCTKMTCCPFPELRHELRNAPRRKAGDSSLFLR
jgi:hypothetical protein